MDRIIFLTLIRTLNLMHIIAHNLKNLDKKVSILEVRRIQYQYLTPPIIQLVHSHRTLTGTNLKGVKMLA